MAAGNLARGEASRKWGVREVGRPRGDDDDTPVTSRTRRHPGEVMRCGAEGVSSRGRWAGDASCVGVSTTPRCRWRKILVLRIIRRCQSVG